MITDKINKELNIYTKNESLEISLLYSIDYRYRCQHLGALVNLGLLAAQLALNIHGQTSGDWRGFACL